MTLSYLKISLVLVLLASAGVLAQEQAKTSAPVKPYGIKSGYVKMTSNLGLTRQLWFDDFGRLQREEVTLAMGGFSQSAVVISDGRWRHEFTPGSTTGNKRAATAAAGPGYLKLSEADRKNFGITDLGTETLAGKTCNVYQMSKPAETKVWVYKGIVMKSISGMQGNSLELEVVEIREEKVEAAKFKLPGNIEFREL